MFAIKITKAAECLSELVEQTNNKSAPIFLTSDTETKVVLLSLKFIYLGLLIALSPQIVAPVKAASLLPNAISRTVKDASLLSQKSMNFETMLIDGYQVRVENASLREMLLPCAIFSTTSNPEEILVLPPCDEGVEIPSDAVFPASNDKSPVDFYRERPRYLVNTPHLLANYYSPQKLVFVSGVLDYYESVTVESIKRVENTWTITVSWNKSDRTRFSAWRGVIVQVDLGYLKPNHYRIIINWNSKFEDEIVNFDIGTLNFTVSEFISH